jgi:hypothetical protein
MGDHRAQVAPGEQPPLARCRAFIPTGTPLCASPRAPALSDPEHLRCPPAPAPHLEIAPPTGPRGNLP